MILFRASGVRRASRVVTVALALGIPLGSGPVHGQDTAKPQAKARRSPTDAEAEAAALAFVRENHPELTAVLAQLKSMKPDEYRRAVRELAQVSRSLDAVRARDPKRYEAGLDVWKAQSRVNLLAARLAGAPDPGPELEGQLRQAVEALVDAEIRQARLETEAAEERLRWSRLAVQRLESRRGSAVETRFQSLLKKSRHTREAAAKTAEPVRPGHQPAAHPNADADTGAGPRKKETQP